jgi:hypothetical protein
MFTSTTSTPFIDHIAVSKVARLTSPHGTPMGVIATFGPLLLALTEDGGQMVVWDTATMGQSLGSAGDRFLTPFNLRESRNHSI